MKRGLGAELSIAGGRPQQNSYLLDGININDYSNAGPGSVLGGNLGVDALQEFTVFTTNPTAQYGRTAAGVISAITRSGTSKFHGSAYEFARNAIFDARNYFDSPQIPAFSRISTEALLAVPSKRTRPFSSLITKECGRTLGSPSSIQFRRLPLVPANSRQER